MKNCATGGECGGGSGGCGLSLRSGVPAVVRLVLGGLFILAGYSKLGDHRGAYDAVNAFHLGFGEQALQVLSRTVPWAELLTGLLLVLGLWARGAAVMLIVMMAGFIAGIASVMVRGLDVNCGCFGKLKLFCGDLPMGWCHLVRNTVMAAGGLLILVMGPGSPALDNCVKQGEGSSGKAGSKSA